MRSKIKRQGKSGVAIALGIVGGIFGVGAGILAILVGGAGLLITTESAQIMWLGLLGTVIGFIGIAGGAISSSNPRFATVLMTIAGLAGFVAVSLFWLLPGALLLIGAWLAWSSQRREEPSAATT